MTDENAFENAFSGAFGRSGKQTTFRTNPANLLGIENRKSRSKLLSLALSKPEEYFELREKIIQALCEEAVNKIYETYWEVLSQGKLPDGKYLMVGGNKLEPKLPETEINKFALKVANMIYQIGEEATDTIAPTAFKELGIQTLENNLSAKGINI